MVEFAGFDMPVSYTSVIKEHFAVRTACGLFDVSHMGELEVRGAGALEFVQRVTTNDARKLKGTDAQYTLVLNEAGGVIDDVIVYRLALERFLFCVNASNVKQVYEWLKARTPERLVIVDQGDKTALLAIQGPKSLDVLLKTSDINPAGIKRFGYGCGKVVGASAIIARTGYTGEDGFELFIDPQSAVRVWEGLMEAGAGFGITPVGLGARDTLRLEMGYPLHGHELTLDTTPLEAGLDRFVSFDKDDFIGRSVLARQKAEGVLRRLVGFEVTGQGIARAGYRVFSGNDEIGVVTSGTHSPTLERSIGMAYVKPGHSKVGAAIEIEIRNRRASARVAALPFYSRPKKDA
jgi:aminomethyltransferase